jgi:hypothetical protein
MEEAFYLVLKKILHHSFDRNDEDKIAVAEKYYSSVGMGPDCHTSFSDKGGEAILARSHVEEGWMKKFGKSSEAVDFLRRGISVWLCFR